VNWPPTPPVSGHEDDSLLQPTIADPVERRPGGRPWQLGSQAYVAFFGGPFAATAVAYANSRRLGAPAETQRLVLLVGLGVSIALTVASFSLFGGFTGARQRDPDVRRVLSFVGRIGAVLLALGLMRLQRRADRHFQMFGAGEYGSLWWPGLLFVLVGTIVSVLLVIGLSCLSGASLL